MTTRMLTLNSKCLIKRIGPSGACTTYVVNMKKVCNEAILPLGFGYTLSIGRYTKYRSTRSDY